MLGMVFQINCVCGFRSRCVFKMRIHLYLMFYDEKQTSKCRALCGLWSAMAHTVVSPGIDGPFSGEDGGT